MLIHASVTPRRSLIVLREGILASPFEDVTALILWLV